jgi:predicted PurR-regulated permease PerM
VATGFVILILAFFLVVEKTALVKAVAFITPEVYQEFVTKVAGKIRQSLGSWLRGQLIMMLAVGLLTYLALTIIGVQYALLLGVVAGLFEIVPFIGPWLSAVPGVIFALAISPVHAVITAAAYLAIQVVEGNVLLPKVMQSVTGLNPIVSLLAVLVGWRVGGVVGVLLSLPITMALGVVMTEIYKKRVLT